LSSSGKHQVYLLRFVSKVDALLSARITSPPAKSPLSSVLVAPTAGTSSQSFSWTGVRSSQFHHQRQEEEESWGKNKMKKRKIKRGKNVREKKQKERKS
jgi:hypothetical protein